MIRLLHHHLRRGGVTRVMATTARILRESGESVELLTGEAPPEPPPPGVEVRVIPGLGYWDPASPTDPITLQEALTSLHTEGDVWHVHNHSLGKNPLVTQCICRMAEEGIPMVLQPHDFAEDGRPANLERITEVMPDRGAGLYPVGPHIQYAVLQDRDRRVLTGAGVPSDQVAVLPNPIGSDLGIPPVDPTSNRLLYLTRAIRRKNVGEFLYWAKRLGDRFEFATSLIPENPVEKKRFDQWTAFAEREGIRVLWGIGMDGRSFDDVVGSAAACITTSVGEGFGMSFLEPYVMGRRVVGRNLPDITKGFQQDGVRLDHLYPSVPVDADRVDAGFWDRAVAQIGQWRKTMGFSQPLTLEELKAAWVEDGQIDLGRIDEEGQRHVIRTLSAGSGNTSDLIPETDADMNQNPMCIRDTYSESATLIRLKALYQSVGRPGTVSYADPSGVREAFADLSALSMLRM